MEQKELTNAWLPRSSTFLCSGHPFFYVQMFSEPSNGILGGAKKESMF
jgi:hypothetical protein